MVIEFVGDSEWVCIGFFVSYRVVIYFVDSNRYNLGVIIYIGDIKYLNVYYIKFLLDGSKMFRFNKISVFY